jgi:hypothetical protein
VLRVRGAFATGVHELETVPNIETSGTLSLHAAAASHLLSLRVFGELSLQRVASAPSAVVSSASVVCGAGCVLRIEEDVTVQKLVLSDGGAIM